MVMLDNGGGRRRIRKGMGNLGFLLALPILPELKGVILDPIPDRLVTEIITGFLRFNPLVFQDFFQLQT